MEAKYFFYTCERIIFFQSFINSCEFHWRQITNFKKSKFKIVPASKQIKKSILLYSKHIFVFQVRSDIEIRSLSPHLYESWNYFNADCNLDSEFLATDSIVTWHLGSSRIGPDNIFMYNIKKRRYKSKKITLHSWFSCAVPRYNGILSLHLLSCEEQSKKSRGPFTWQEKKYWISKTRRLKSHEADANNIPLLSPLLYATNDSKCRRR